MNYYERHLGDYAKDTAHLSMLEHGAYGLLLDRYYSTEHGIEADQAHRVTRARTRDERAAVDSVLAEFFTLDSGVWKHRRVEAEIAKARQRMATARENGKAGGRPKKGQQKTREEPTGLWLGSVLETQQEPAGFPLGSVLETQTKAHHAPCTTHSVFPDGNTPFVGASSPEPAPPTPPAPAAKKASPRGTRLPADWQPGPAGLEFAASIGLANGKATAEAEKFRDYWHAKAGAAASKTDWLATWRNWCREAVARVGKQQTPAQGAPGRYYEMR